MSVARERQRPEGESDGVLRETYRKNPKDAWDAERNWTDASGVEAPTGDVPLRFGLQLAADAIDSARQALRPRPSTLRASEIRQAIKAAAIGGLVIVNGAMAASTAFELTKLGERPGRQSNHPIVSALPEDARQEMIDVLGALLPEPPSIEPDQDSDKTGGGPPPDPDQEAAGDQGRVPERCDEEGQAVQGGGQYLFCAPDGEPITFPEAAERNLLSVTPTPEPTATPVPPPQVGDTRINPDTGEKEIFVNWDPLEKTNGTGGQPYKYTGWVTNEDGQGAIPPQPPTLPDDMVKTEDGRLAHLGEPCFVRPQGEPYPVRGLIDPSGKCSRSYETGPINGFLDQNLGHPFANAISTVDGVLTDMVPAFRGSEICIGTAGQDPGEGFWRIEDDECGDRDDIGDY